MNPLVSVIVPAYNVEHTVEKCVDSLLNQTLKEIEIIVINDCSKDGTLNVLKKYGDKIKLIENEKNLGPAASRNKGLNEARGTYIGFVDADDWVAPNMYELMSSKMSKEVDLVACSRINITKKGAKPIINKNEETDAKAFTKTSNYNCDKLFKREIIEKYHLRLPEEYSYAEDFAFGIRYKYYANEMRILQEPLYYYLADSEGSITNSYQNNLLNIIDVLEDMLVFFKENNAYEKYEKELLELCAAFYVRRIKEFKNFDNKRLQREFVRKFLQFFQNNFKQYKTVVNRFKTRYNKFYRSSYVMMLLYIQVQCLRREK